MIEKSNDMLSYLKKTAKSLMVGRKNNQQKGDQKLKMNKIECFIHMRLNFNLKCLNFTTISCPRHLEYMTKELKGVGAVLKCRTKGLLSY